MHFFRIRYLKNLRSYCPYMWKSRMLVIFLVAVVCLATRCKTDTFFQWLVCSSKDIFLFSRAAQQSTGGKRSIIISRSSFPGSGHYSGRWLGDNQSAWNHLYHSVIGALEFNLFGIPFVSFWKWSLNVEKKTHWRFCRCFLLFPIQETFKDIYFPSNRYGEQHRATDLLMNIWKLLRTK